MSHIRIPAADLRPGDVLENLWGGRLRVTAVTGPLEGRDSLDVTMTDDRPGSVYPFGLRVVEVPAARLVNVYSRRKPTGGAP